MVSILIQKVSPFNLKLLGYQSMFISFFRNLAISAATIITFSLGSFTQANAVNYVSVNTDNVNVRTGPGTSYQVTMELFKGYPLKVISTQADWLKVTDFENDNGWIHQSLVVSGNTVIVSGSNSVNMRTEPSTKSAVIANVDRGVVLTKLESKGKWLKVKHASGVIGWMYKPLLWP